MASDVVARDMFMNIQFIKSWTKYWSTLLEKRNIVYDVASINYRNNDKKECDWREIAEEVNRDGKHFSVIANKIR